MKTSLHPVAILVLLSAITPSAAAQHLQVAEEAFSIALPPTFTKADKQSSTAAVEEGPIQTTNWIYRATTGEVVIVAMSQLPARVLDAETMLTNARDALVKSLQGRLESEEVLAGDLPARKVLFRRDSPSPAFLRSRLIVNHDRFYQLLYVGLSPEQRSADDVTLVFESFRIAPLPQTIVSR